MKYNSTKGKKIPGVPGGKIRHQRRKVASHEREEILEELLDEKTDSEEKSDESENEQTESDESQQKLAKRVWKRIPDDLEPHLRKFDHLIGMGPRLAYERCEDYDHLGDCSDFVEITSRLDEERVVADRIGDIRDRHQDNTDS